MDVNAFLRIAYALSIQVIVNVVVFGSLIGSDVFDVGGFVIISEA